MWITQTYLGTVEPDADLFIYYMFRDYNDEETTFTKQLQARLEELGEVFGNKVCLTMPNPRYFGRIEAEVRENRALWNAIHKRLPGLLLSTKPLVQIEEYGDTCFFVPFASENDVLEVDLAVQKIKKLADDAIAWDYKTKEVSHEPSFIDRLLGAIELKPGIAGFKIDLRQLFRR